MAVVYTHNLQRRHTASRCSLAYCVFILMAAIAILLPFFIAYSASGADFWLKTNTLMEQAVVKYEYKLILVLEGTKEYGANPQLLFFSTLSSLNALMQHQVRLPVLRSAEIDADLDGVADRLELEASVPITNDEAIYSAKLFIFFNYQLREHARLEMESLAYASASSPLAGQALFMDGELEWHQRWPLTVKGGYSTPYDEDDLLDFDSLLPWKGTSRGAGAVLAQLPEMLATYGARNFTTQFNTQNMLWTGVTPASPLSSGEASTFNLTANIHFPLQEIIYSPAVSEVLFDAWIKYYAALVIVMYLLDLLCSFIFYHQLVETYVHSDQPTLARHGMRR